MLPLNRLIRQHRSGNRPGVALLEAIVALALVVTAIIPIVVGLTSLPALREYSRDRIALAQLGNYKMTVLTTKLRANFDDPNYQNWQTQIYKGTIPETTYGNSYEFYLVKDDMDSPADGIDDRCKIYLKVTLMSTPQVSEYFYGEVIRGY